MELEDMAKAIIFVIFNIFIITVMFGFVSWLSGGSDSKTLVSDRITACESKGGKYDLEWSNYSNKYKELCRVEAQYIDNF